jgi:type IV secretory pathway VirB10-like protein
MDQPQTGAQPLPAHPAGLQPQGISNRARRWMFLGVIGLVTLIVLANIIGSPSTPGAAKTAAPSAQQQQNPTAAEIRDTEAALAQQQADLLSKTAQDAARLRQLQQQAGANPNADMNDQLARLQDAQARERAGANNPGTAAPADNQKAQLEAERRAQERKALFADNVVRQERPSGLPDNAPQSVTGAPSGAPGYSVPETPERRVSAPPVTASAPAGEKGTRALDFAASRKTYWLPEGTVIEAVLTNRLDGDGVGPVNCMITTDVYLPGTRLCLIPQGSRVLGEASKVAAAGQQRLAVAFHRIIVPGLQEYSIPLDSKPPALAQAGETGLHDRVNSHYGQIFGASLAIGAIGGLAQIGNGQNGFGYDPSVQFRNGVTSGMAQSSERILDRFLNRLPTITIREGTRTRILLTDDLKLPAFERNNE